MLLFSIFYKFLVATHLYLFCVRRFFVCEDFRIAKHCFCFGFSCEFCAFLLLFCAFLLCVDASPVCGVAVLVFRATVSPLRVSFASCLRCFAGFLRCFERVRFCSGAFSLSALLLLLPGLWCFCWVVAGVWLFVRVVGSLITRWCWVLVVELVLCFVVVVGWWWFWCVGLFPLFCVVLVDFGCGLVRVLLLGLLGYVFLARWVFWLVCCATLGVGVSGAFLVMVSCGFSRRFLVVLFFGGSFSDFLVGALIWVAGGSPAGGGSGSGGFFAHDEFCHRCVAVASGLLCWFGLVFCLSSGFVSEEFVDSCFFFLFCSEFVCSGVHSVFLLLCCCWVVLPCFCVLLLVFVSFFSFFRCFVCWCSDSVVVVVSAFWQIVFSVPFVLCFCFCFLSVASVCSAPDMVSGLLFFFRLSVFFCCLFSASFFSSYFFLFVSLVCVFSCLSVLCFC